LEFDKYKVETNKNDPKAHGKSILWKEYIKLIIKKLLFCKVNIESIHLTALTRTPYDATSTKK